MKDKSMLSFYHAHPALGCMSSAYEAWCSWCADHDERPGTLPEFVGRLRRTHEHLQRNHRQGGRCPVKGR